MGFHFFFFFSFPPHLFFFLPERVRKNDLPARATNLAEAYSPWIKLIPMDWYQYSGYILCHADPCFFPFFFLQLGSDYCVCGEESQHTHHLLFFFRVFWVLRNYVNCVNYAETEDIEFYSLVCWVGWLDGYTTTQVQRGSATI